MRMRALPAALGLVAILGAACSSDDDSTIDAGAGSEAEAGHNDADVEFAQGMIPHHEQAVEMAQLAPDRAESDEVKDLATRIEAAQDPEIEEMEGWLADWDEEADSMDDMGHGGDSGMMSESEMDDLEAASGDEFDRMFLEMMLAHHSGAVEMAETEIDDGEFPDAIALAENIKSTQETEITEMESLLEQL